MSTTTDDATAGPDHENEIRAAMAAATTDHKVELATSHYHWQTPLDVVKTEPATEWDVPYSTDWFQRTIIVEATQCQYALVYNSIPTPPQAECYRYEDGAMAMFRGSIEHLAVFDTPSDGGYEHVLVARAKHRSANIYHAPDPDHPGQPGCQMACKSDIWNRRTPDQLDDDWSLCGHCNPNTAEDDDQTDDSDQGGDESEPAVELPDDVTEADIEAAIDEHKTGRGGGAKADLGHVADELGLTPGRTRVLLVGLDYYQDEIRDLVRRAGGGR